MKKFLSILALACLLALGMALPAAAVGEETQLFAAFSPDEKTPFRTLKLPKDVTKTIYFFTTSDGANFERVTEGTYTVSGDAVEFDGVDKVTGSKITGEGELVKIEKDGSGLSPVEINVVPSQFEVSLDGVEWQTSLNDLKVGDSVGVNFRLVAKDKTLNIYDDNIRTSDIIINPASGLSFNNRKLSATAAGEYKLKYKDYSIPVSVSANSITIELQPNPQNTININMDFLHEKGYSDSGDVTLLVPAGNLGRVTCNAQLPDGATLTLKGISDTDSIMTGLTIDGSEVIVDSIHFKGAPGIDVKNVTECTVSNCKFDQLPFRICTSETETAPTLVLTKNIYTGTEFAAVVDYLGQEVGKWLASPKSQPETAYLNLGIYINDKEDIANSTVQTLNFYVNDSVDGVLEEWELKFKLPCGFVNPYVACEGEKGDGTFESDTTPKYYTAIIARSGNYTVVEGPYPKLSNKNEVYVSALNAKYLQKVTVDTTFSGATVTHNSKQVDASINNNKLTFHLSVTNAAGTYKVTATTAASNKSSVQNRNYKYTYQDFYQVTPAGFTNAMRYVKDNLVTLNCTEAGTRSISLPVASMTAAAEKGYSVLVKTKNAELTMDAAALKSIAQQAKGTTVLLHYKSLNHKTLTTVGQASIQSHLDQFPGDNADLAFLVTATSDSETIEDLQMGAITLRIPFILLPGTEGMANTVYALQSESIAEARETTVADGHLTTRLLDLTEHMVFLTTETAQPTEETTEPTEETTEPTEVTETTQPETVPETTQPAQPEEETGGSPILTMVIVFGVVLLIGCGALGFLILRKRFRK